MTNDTSAVMREGDSDAADTCNIPEVVSAVQEKSRGVFYDKTKVKAILDCFDKDILAADLKWNLFVAACQSYKYDSCLRPFPPMFYKDGFKDINSLLEILDQTPTFTLLLRFLQNPEKYQPNSTVIDLVYWVLIQLKEPKLKTVSKSAFDKILKLVPSEIFAQRPNYIFEIAYGSISPAEVKWQAVKEGFSTMFAYHGSRLDNFHSIIYHGLQQHMNKNSLFGQGIYLSSELLVSLPYSPNGYGWGKSILGSELSTVALCEMVDHPTINCQSEGETGDKSIPVTSNNRGEVPHKYYVVSNSDLVRVRYLLVYSRAPPLPYIRPEQHGSIMGWMAEHKLITVILGYALMLASVGLSNNQYVRRCYRLLCQQIGLHS